MCAYASPPLPTREAQPPSPGPVTPHPPLRCPAVFAMRPRPAVLGSRGPLHSRSSEASHTLGACCPWARRPRPGPDPARPCRPTAGPRHCDKGSEDGRRARRGAFRERGGRKGRTKHRRGYLLPRCARGPVDEPIRLSWANRKPQAVSRRSERSLAHANCTCQLAGLDPAPPPETAAGPANSRGFLRHVGSLRGAMRSRRLAASRLPGPGACADTTAAPPARTGSQRETKGRIR